MIKEGDDYSDPEFIEFDNDKIIHFEVVDSYKMGDLLKKEIWSERLSETKIELINANRIRFFQKGIVHKILRNNESITSDQIFKVDYELIKPTKTILTKEEIEKLEFSAEWKNEKIHFIFNKGLDSQLIQETNKWLKREKRKLFLEKLKDTYFVAIYNNGERETLIPIREIDNRKVTLYGFPKEPYEIIGN